MLCFFWSGCPHGVRFVVLEHRGTRTQSDRLQDSKVLLGEICKSLHNRVVQYVHSVFLLVSNPLAARDEPPLEQSTDLEEKIAHNYTSSCFHYS